MGATIATGKDLKRVSVFIAPNGQKYEGTAADYYEGSPTLVKDDLGRTGQTDRVAEEAGEDKKE